MLSAARVFRFAMVCAVFLPASLAGPLHGAQAVGLGPPEPVVIISLNDCRQLAAQQVAKVAPDDEDQDAPYGAMTAASSLPRSLSMPEDIAIDITAEVQQRFGLSTESNLFKSETGVATMLLKPDGTATANGQSLGEAEIHAVAVLCQAPTPQPLPRPSR